KDGSLHFVSSDTALFINGRLAGVRLGNAPPLTSWFDTGDLDLIRSLRVLLVDEGGYAQKQTLKKIASIKPVLSLQLNTPPDADELKFMLGLFDPPALSLETDVSSLQLLAGENELKALYLNLDDSMAVLSPLPAIPNLNTLMANLSKDSVLDLRKPHGGFFKNNPQVQHVVLSQWADAYPKGLLSELKDLRTLVAFGSAIGSEEILAHEQSLRRLMTDTLDLQLKLPRLQHASVANSAEQAGLLDTLVSKFPQLSALDIYADGGPMDISPILSLAQLKALTIVDADSIDITPLKQMTQLKMLSFSTADSLQESKLDELKTALPATLVVPNEGFCLGSGWLLLLVPFTMLAIYLAGKGQSKKKFTVQ
ncbi:MAG TPA: hypothetical protein VK907_08980, partial [Phnomibacter sp.]|nr:hypothetical protein [Phnomibacter sp.]